MRLRAAKFREVVEDGAFYGQPHSEPVEEGETDARLGIFRERGVGAVAENSRLRPQALSIASAG